MANYRKVQRKEVVAYDPLRNYANVLKMDDKNFCILDPDLPQGTFITLANLKRKSEKGKYNHALAVKAFENLMNFASMKYSREEGYSRENLFDVPTRKHAARELADHYKDEVGFKSNPFRVLRAYRKKRRK